MDEAWPGAGSPEHWEFLTGDAEFTPDLASDRDELLHLDIHRSPYGSARLAAIDPEPAHDLAGVVDVVTGRDLAASPTAGRISVDGPFPEYEPPAFPLLATDQARFSGEAVVGVLAETPVIARDGVQRVRIDWERTPAVTTIEEALAADAPLVHDSLSANTLFTWEFGDQQATATALQTADEVIDLEIANPRVQPTPLEPRGAIADFDTNTGELTVAASTQTPHGLRRTLAEVLGLPTRRIRVVAPAVGGGFGSKGGAPKAGEALAAWCAVRMGRPVAWIATRTENSTAGPHGRANHVTGRLGINTDGRIQGLRLDVQANAGAYPVWGQLGVKHIKRLSSGAYDIPAIAGQATGVVTNTAPVAPYRGAGRPEANYLVERLVDRAAATLGHDPTEIRRRNYFEPARFPVETAVGTTYDSGEYERALDRALDLIDYPARRERQAELREHDRYLGIGVASFVENTGTPGSAETARVCLTADGTIEIASGTAAHGQQHAPVFTQLVAEELGLDPADIEYHDRDTDAVSHGVGTFASRSAPMAGSAVTKSAREILEAAQRVAATALETPISDIEFTAGEFRVVGAPARSIHLTEIAERVHSHTPTPVGPDALDVTTTYDMDDYAFSFGTHAAVVEVDPATGDVDLHQYVAVDDCGVQYDEAVVEGQVQGGIAQGLGEALAEKATYDETGTLQSTSLLEYGLPRAADVPELAIDSSVTPSPVTRTGAKGIGESGTIAAPPTIVNAVIDALAPFGVTHLQKPLTAERIWRAITNHTMEE